MSKKPIDAVAEHLYSMSKTELTGAILEICSLLYFDEDGNYSEEESAAAESSADFVDCVNEIMGDIGVYRVLEEMNEGVRK